MHTLSAVVLVLVVGLTGCKKKEDNAAAPTPTPAGSAVVADPGPPASCKDAGKNYAKVLSADPTTDLGKDESGMQGLMKYEDMAKNKAAHLAAEAGAGSAAP